MRDMRRIIFSILPMLLLGSLAVMTFGCSDKDKETNTPKGIEVNLKTVSMTAEGGTKVVTVTSNHTEFSVFTDASWISHSQVNKSIQLTIEPNGSKSSREATVIVESVSDGSSATINVVQLGLDAALIVDKTAVSAPQDGESVEISITSNIEWKAVCAENWIETEIDESGENLTVTILENETFESRTAVIGIVPVSEEFADLKQEITVSQQARAYEISVVSDELENGTVQVLAVAEDDVVLNVVANSDWTVSKSAEWLTITPVEGEATDELGVDVTFSFTENGEISDRSDEVVFACGNKEIKVNVIQKGAALFLDLLDTEKDKKTNDEATEWIISARSNGTLSATSSAEWITTSVEGLNVKISVTANGGAKREGTATITASLAGNEDISETFTITQLPTATDLSAGGTANCYIVRQAGTYKLNATVQGNGASTLRITPETMNPTDGILVWASSDKDIVSDVLVKDGWLYFTTSGEEGNAVVGAREGGVTGKYIAWSWHIWMTDFDSEDASNQHEVTNLTTAVPATWMDRNLGALSNGSLGTKKDVHKSFGLMYQWGRKDPFPGVNIDNVICDGRFDAQHDAASSGWPTYPTTTESAEKIFYYVDSYDDGAGNTVIPTSNDAFKMVVNTAVEDADMSTVQSIVDYAIMNPHVFIAPSATPYAWFYSGAAADLMDADASNGWGHLWGNMPDRSTYVCATEGKDYFYQKTYWLETGSKSIYDPCPVGWRVPSTGEFRFITSHGDNLGRGYVGASPWKANTWETYKAFNDGTVWQDVKTARTNANTHLTFKDWGWGFNFYIHGHPTGAAPAEEDADNYKNAEIYTSVPDDDATMFLPAAGQLRWWGVSYVRPGGACHYLSSQPARPTALNVAATPKPEILLPGIEASILGNFYEYYHVDFGQIASGNSVRCVKIQD